MIELNELTLPYKLLSALLFAEEVYRRKYPSGYGMYRCYGCDLTNEEYRPILLRFAELGVYGIQPSSPGGCTDFIEYRKMILFMLEEIGKISYLKGALGDLWETYRKLKEKESPSP